MNLRGAREAWYAALAYVALAVLATWPLALGLGRDVPRDLGDSVLTMWIIAWDSERILRLLHGHADALRTFFNANIFYPAPLTLAYSEHFIPQALQVLPVYAITRNPILCYNLLFLSTFVLSGVGMFLFVRDIVDEYLDARGTEPVGSARAGPTRFAPPLVAGLLFAFAPYRIAQASHLAVLSAQWMPFALWGLRRYLTTRRRRPLAGAAAALVVQNLSCGYYLLYFSPFAAMYAVWEMWRRGLLRSARVWGELAMAAVAVAVVTLPFLLPYVAVREQLQLGRATSEVVRYSADVYSYATAYIDQPVWGAVVQAFPKPEGELFPGLITLILAALGTLLWRDRPFAWGASDSAAAPVLPYSGRDRAASLVLLVSAIYALAALVSIIYRRVVVDAFLFQVRLSDATRLIVITVALLLAGCAISRVVRARTIAFLQSRGFFVLAAVAAVWLSLGPTPQSLGRPIDLFAPYGVLHEHVPGFDAVRVPARMAMVVALMLSALAGLGLAALASRNWMPWVAATASVLFLAESLALPMQLNGVTPPPGLATPDARLYRPQRAPAVYRAVARRAPNAVLAELPLGQPDYDLRAMYYSVVHWRPLLNGYSGFFPPDYGQIATAVSDVPTHPDVAVNALRTAGATLVLIHEGAFQGEDGRKTSAALRKSGAVEVFRDGGDVLLELTPNP
jgi:hypothetical protein